MAVLLLVAAGAAAVAQTPKAAASLLNKQAPEFTLRALDGGTVNLRSDRGKVVLLDFWATWCASCLVDMPIFTKWQTEYGRQGFTAIGVSMDDDEAMARKAAEKLKPGYPVAMGDAKLGSRYGGVMGLPLVFLIDANGVVRDSFQGETDPGKIENALQLLLKRR